MSYQVERQTKTLIEFMTYSYCYSDVINESRNSRSIKLLYEAQADDKVNTAAVEKTITSVKTEAGKFLEYIPAESGAELRTAMKALIDKIPDPKSSSVAMFAGDEEKVRAIAKDVTITTANATKGLSCIANAVIKLSSALESFSENLQEQDRTTPIADLVEKVKTESDWKDKFISRTQLDAGIQKIFVPTEAFQTALKRGMKAAAGAPGKGLKGMLQATARFFVAYNQKKANESFPELLAAFTAFIDKTNVNELSELSKKLETNNRQILGTAENAGKLSTDATEAAEKVGEGTEGTEEKADEEGEPPADLKSAAEEAVKASEEATTIAKQSTLGTALHKSFLDYMKPFADRKSLSAKQRKTLEDAADDLRQSVTSEMTSASEITSDAIKDTLSKWFNGLDDNTKKSLGGAKGSQKIVQKMAQNLEDLVKSNFEMKESRHRKLSDVILFEDHDRSREQKSFNQQKTLRWQKLAGINEED